MKQQDYILKIDNPCHQQDWNDMSASDTGKFCTQCSKTVVDFTNLTDKEIIKVIEQNSGELCGRLTNQQQHRLLITKNEHYTKPHLYKLLSGLLLLGAVENSSATPIVQTEIVRTIQNNENQTINKIRPIDSLKNIIRGQVIDAQTKTPIPLATVGIKNTKANIETNNEGKFKLIVPDSLLTNKIALIIASIGYEHVEIIVDKNELPLIKELLLTPKEQHTMGAVVIIGVKKKKWWQRKKKSIH